MNWLLKLMYKYNFFMGIEKLYTFLPYYFGGGKSFHPVSLVFSPSYECNARCQHCLYWNDKNAPVTRARMKERKELHPFAIYGMLEQAKNIGIKTLSIHGGEPTIYPYFERLLETAQDFGFTTNFFTNGMNFSPYLCKVVCDCDVNIITFSIHGTEKIHDSIMRNKGYHHIMEALKYFRNLKEAGHKIPDLRASTTIQRDNQDTIAKLYYALINTGISNLTIQLPWVLDAVDDDVTNVDMDIVLKEKWKIKCLSINHKYPKVTFSTDEAINSLKDGNKTYKAMDYCPGLYTRLYVNPYGDVIPCISLDAFSHTLGNVKQNTLKEIWNGEQFKSYRRNMRGNLPDLCSFCCFLDRMEVL